MSRFLPDPAGPAPARLLHGFVVGARDCGRPVEVRSWWPEPPASGVAGDVIWAPLPPERRIRTKARAVVRPRSDVLAARWSFRAEAVVVADELLSAPAAVRHERSVVTLHYSTALDARAAGRRPQQVQDRRAEVRAIRRAGLATAYSDRVAEATGAGAVVPAAIQFPDAPLPVVDEPVAACVADWRWGPNLVALRWLLAAWSGVRARLPAAELLLAGYGSAPAAAVDGVRWLGTVGDSLDVLSSAALLAFPCPPTSGPKVKVLEAVAAGLPVLTTPAGLEGLALTDEHVALVRSPEAADELSARVVATLLDTSARAERAHAARAALAAAHAPAVAAAKRLALYDEVFG